ncbi:MAG: LysE superfamily transporter [Hyphomonadaceae bacterium]|nr:MAG: LysE superfamily transporter [Hyphomonadaceae bacterium]KAF0183459.1 MAG: LysE superfamily transporter [Hyphomonadaceae bacterium]
MTAATLFALCLFAFVSSITPGPNNMMLFASGVNFGFRKTIPHMLGIGFGFGIMVICVGLGLGKIFENYPSLYLAIKIAGSIYLLWIAYHIATDTTIGEAKSSAKPMTFLGAALFQWVNPKAWVMAITAVVAYTKHYNYFGSLILISLIFVAINVPCVSLWAGFGTLMQKFLSNPKTLKIFNIGMAVLLVLSLAPIVF